MARKSKGFEELLSESKYIQQQEKQWEDLKEKLSKTSTREKIEEKIQRVKEAPGVEKMSEVLLEFIEPYREYVDTKAAMKRLIGMAVMAWNTSLEPENEQEEMVEEIVNEIVKDDDEELKKQAKQILEELITRKKSYFSENKRMIMDVTINKKAGKDQLSVISNLIETTDEK